MQLKTLKPVLSNLLLKMNDLLLKLKKEVPEILGKYGKFDNLTDSGFFDRLGSFILKLFSNFIRKYYKKRKENVEKKSNLFKIFDFF